MALRIVEIFLGADAAVYFKEPFDDVKIQGIWRQGLEDQTQLIRILLESDQAEKLMDICTERYGSLPEFRCLVMDVSASIPRFEEESDDAPKKAEPEENPLKGKRISREELYADIEGPTRITTNYLAMVALSTIVASLGLMRDNVAVIIGAMVIAPLLGPNLALSLATLLADSALAKRAVKAIMVGVAEAMIIALIIGLTLSVNENAAEISSRTYVGIGDVVLALCAGAAGALSFTGQVSSSLVGVMVAVALLPPLTASGLLFAKGNWAGAAGAGLLFLINLAGVNLTGLIVLLLQKIQPSGKDNIPKAKKSTYGAIIFWASAMLLLILAMQNIAA